MTYKEEQRYRVSGFHNAELVDTFVDEEGNVALWSYLDDEDYYPPGGEDRFFTGKSEAENYSKELIPKEIDRLREYLSHLYESDNFEELKKILPGGMFNMFLEGYKNLYHFTNNEMDRIKKAFKGYLDIGPVTIRIADIQKVVVLNGSRREIRLNDGSTYEVASNVGKIILDAIFGTNHTGKCLNR